MADTQDLKSCEGIPSCGFESRLSYCRFVGSSRANFLRCLDYVTAASDSRLFLHRIVISKKLDRLHLRRRCLTAYASASRQFNPSVAFLPWTRFERPALWSSIGRLGWANRDLLK